MLPEVVDTRSFSTACRTLPGERVTATSLAGFEWEWVNPVTIRIDNQVSTYRQPWETVATGQFVTSATFINDLPVQTDTLRVIRQIAPENEKEESKNLERTSHRPVRQPRR